MGITYTYQDVAIADIVIDQEFNARGEVGDVGGLTSSIKAEGITTPLAIHEKRNGKLHLIEGFRRIAAAEAAGLTEVPCKVYPKGTKKKELFLLNLLENSARQNLNPMEEARAVHRLLDAGMAETDAREALGWSKTLMTQRLGLLDLPEVIQTAVAEDRITVTQARAIAELPDDHHARFVERAEDLSTNRLRSEVDGVLERINAAENPEPVDSVGGDDVEDDVEGEAEDDVVQPANIASAVQASLCDVACFAFDEGDAEQEESFASAALSFRSVDFTKLTVDELTALRDAIFAMTQEIGCTGKAEDRLAALVADEPEGEEGDVAEDAQIALDLNEDEAAA